jgi:hypothetical protein
MIPQVLLDAESNFMNFIPIIKEAQESYLEANGVYWQGLWTHKDPPSDDNGEVPDNLDSSPPDQTISWSDVIASSSHISSVFPELMVLRIRIDVYESVAKKGYIASLQKMIEDTLWEKSFHIEGPVTIEDEWHIVQ